MLGVCTGVRRRVGFQGLGRWLLRRWLGCGRGSCGRQHVLHTRAWQASVDDRLEPLLPVCAKALVLAHAEALLRRNGHIERVTLLEKSIRVRIAPVLGPHVAPHVLEHGNGGGTDA